MATTSGSNLRPGDLVIVKPGATLKHYDILGPEYRLRRYQAVINKVVEVNSPYYNDNTYTWVISDSFEGTSYFLVPNEFLEPAFTK
jgi:hypothetical protein